MTSALCQRVWWSDCDWYFLPVGGGLTAAGFFADMQLLFADPVCLLLPFPVLFVLLFLPAMAVVCSDLSLTASFGTCFSA